MSGEIHGSQPNPLLLNLNNINLDPPTAEATKYSFTRIGNKRAQETQKDTTSAAETHNDSAIKFGLSELRGNAMASMTMKDLNRLRQNLINRATPGDPALPIIPQSWIPKCMEQARALGIPVQVDSQGHLTIGGETVDSESDQIPDDFMEALVEYLSNEAPPSADEAPLTQETPTNQGQSAVENNAVAQSRLSSQNNPAASVSGDVKPQQTSSNQQNQNGNVASAAYTSNTQATSSTTLGDSAIIAEARSEANAADTARSVARLENASNPFFNVSALTTMFILYSKMANQMTVAQAKMGDITLESMACIVQTAKDNAELTIQAGEKEKENYDLQAQQAMMNMYAAVTVIVLSTVAFAVSTTMSMREPKAPPEIENPDEQASLQGNIGKDKPGNFKKFDSNSEPYPKASTDFDEIKAKNQAECDAFNNDPEVNVGQQKQPMTDDGITQQVEKNKLFNKINNQRTAELAQWKSDYRAMKSADNLAKALQTIVPQVGEMMKNGTQMITNTKQGVVALEKAKIEAEKAILQGLSQIYTKQLDTAMSAMQTDADNFNKAMEALTNMITATRQGIEATNR